MNAVYLNFLNNNDENVAQFATTVVIIDWIMELLLRKRHVVISVVSR